MGVAAGIAGASSIAVGTAAGIGAAAGGVAGLTADGIKAGEHEEAAYETGFVLERDSLPISPRSPRIGIRRWIRP